MITRKFGVILDDEDIYLILKLASYAKKKGRLLQIRSDGETVACGIPERIKLQRWADEDYNTVLIKMKGSDKWIEIGDAGHLQVGSLCAGYSEEMEIRVL